MPRAPRLLLTRPPSKTATPHVPIESAWRRHCRWEASCCGLRKALLLIRPPSPVPPCSGGGCASIARTSTGCPPTAAVTVLRRAQEPRTVDESQRNDHQQPRRRRARCMVHRRRQATTYWSDVQKGRRHLAMPPMPVDRVDHPPAKACQPPRARPAIFPSSPLHLPLPASDLCREDSAPYRAWRSSVCTRKSRAVHRDVRDARQATQAGAQGGIFPPLHLAVGEGQAHPTSHIRVGYSNVERRE